ncbi:MAG: helix-turn-helix domain-containing protein [Ruminococcus sp.]|nr:helix-turn-helix domain-containing protein [Ruminococcus sp.]
MNQIKTGKFIAQMRKEKGMTQTQLAELLYISNKTVSKWETGKGMPEVSLMLPLCEALEINVNELLTGERIPEKNYIEKAEENMMNLVHEAQESKKKIILSVMTIVLTLLSAIPLILISGIFEMAVWARVILIAISVIIIVIGLAIACILDRDAGSFECEECHQRFVPEFGAYIMSVHTITRRKLKCPKCGKSTYCKHVMTK